MTDVFTSEQRSAVMRRVKGRDTGPERRVRALLWAAGLRYRLQGYRWRGAKLPGSPDLVLPGRRAAVFVHGCFWHGHDCPRGSRVPKQNRDYWLAKVARNRARDAAAAEILIAAGWRAVTVWECELRDEAALGERLLAELTPG